MLRPVAPTQFNRFLLRSIWDGAKRAGTSLADALKAALVSDYSDVGHGRILTATSVGGHSVSFQIPQLGYHMTPANVVESVEYLLTLVEGIQAGTPAPANDSATYATALRELHPVTEFTSDFRMARIAEGVGR